MEIINEKVPYFGEEGLNCAESSLRLLIERGVVDVPMDSIRLFTGLGGGAGCSGGPCGVVVGCTAAIGSKLGRSDPSQAHWQPTIDVRNVFLERFKERFGHLTCDGLTEGLVNESVETQKLCSTFVLGGVEIATEIINELDEGPNNG